MEEAADAEANVHYRVNDPDYPNFPSLAQCLRKDAGLPEESLPVRFLFPPLAEARSDAQTAIGQRMFRMLQEEHDKEKHGMPLRLHQYLLGQVRLFEMQRFNDIRQQTRAIRSTPFHLATMTSLDLLGLDADLHRFSSLVKHRLLAIYTVSRAIQTRKIPIAPGPWREDAMSVVLGSIDTEEFDAVPDAEKASIRQYFARHAPLQRMVSSFPDRPE